MTIRCRIHAANVPGDRTVRKNQFRSRTSVPARRRLCAGATTDFTMERKTNASSARSYASTGRSSRTSSRPRQQGPLVAHPCGPPVAREDPEAMERAYALPRSIRLLVGRRQPRKTTEDGSPVDPLVRRHWSSRVRVANAARSRCARTATPDRADSSGIRTSKTGPCTHVGWSSTTSTNSRPNISTRSMPG